MNEFEAKLAKLFGGSFKVLYRTHVGASVLVQDALLVTGSLEGDWFSEYEIDVGGGRIIYSPESVAGNANFLLGVVLGRGLPLTGDADPVLPVAEVPDVAHEVNLRLGWDSFVKDDGTIEFPGEHLSVHLVRAENSFSVRSEGKPSVSSNNFSMDASGVLRAAGYMRSRFGLFDEYPA